MGRNAGTPIKQPQRAWDILVAQSDRYVPNLRSAPTQQPGQAVLR